MTYPGGTNLAAAACGIYCGACPLWRASHDAAEKFAPPDRARPGGDTCAGCRSDHLSKYCLDCEFRTCVVEKGLATCADCDEMPCERLRSFAADGVPHHAGVVSSLALLRRQGMDNWYENQRRRWSCSSCKTQFEWYSKTCVCCGATVPGFEE
jgi:hypothetical protein